MHKEHTNGVRNIKGRNLLFAGVLTILICVFAAGKASAALCDYSVSPPICGEVPNIFFSASPNPVNYQNSSMLSWTLQYLGSGDCTPSGWVWPGTTNGTLSTGNLSNSTTYTLSCTNQFGSGSASVLVNVETIPAVINACTYGLTSDPSVNHSPGKSSGTINIGENVSFFIDYTHGTGGPPGYNNWVQWSLGDGMTDTAESPNRTYTSPGLKNIKVEVWYGPAFGSGEYAWCTIYPNLNIVKLANGEICNPPGPTGLNLNCISNYCSPTTNECAVPPPPTGVSCSPDKTSVTSTSGETVRWTANATSNIPGETLTYSWSGTDRLDGSGPTVDKIYTSAGAKSASVTVGYQSYAGTTVTQACSPAVTVVAPNGCNNGTDDDGDGLIDGQEFSCESGETTEGLNPAGRDCVVTGNCVTSPPLICHQISTRPSYVCTAPSEEGETCFRTPDCVSGLICDLTYRQCIPRVVPAPPPVVTSCTVSPSCIQPDEVASVQATVRDGSAPLVYEWKDNGSVVSGLRGSSISPSPSNTGTHTYFVTVTDSSSGRASLACTPSLNVADDCSNVCIPSCTLPETCGGGGVPGQCGGGPGNPTNCPPGEICNALGTTNIYEFLVKAMKAFVNLLIPIIVLFYIIVGLMFITARGAPEKLKVAKTAFLYVTIGTAVVLGAWALAEMIQSTITSLQ